VNAVPGTDDEEREVLQALQGKKTLYVLIQRQAGTQTLVQWLAQQKAPLTRQVVRGITFQLLMALHCVGVEFGFVHCDIKPYNVMVDDEPIHLKYALRNALGKYDVYQLPEGNLRPSSLNPSH
jgi:RIO-like serine/threonine protein kinase